MLPLLDKQCLIKFFEYIHSIYLKYDKNTNKNELLLISPSIRNVYSNNGNVYINNISPNTYIKVCDKITGYLKIGSINKEFGTLTKKNKIYIYFEVGKIEDTGIDQNGDINKIDILFDDKILWKDGKNIKAYSGGKYIIEIVCGQDILMAEGYKLEK